MNILFTSDLSGLGGGETSLVNLSTVLKKNNNIYVLCAEEGRLNAVLRENQIPVFVLNYRDKGKLFLNILKIRCLAKKYDIDIIHSNDPLTSIIMHYAVTGMNVRTFWTCHGQWYNFKGIRKVLIKRANKYVFCVSTKVQESLQKMGFRNTMVSYLGIPLEKYQNAVPTRIREELGLPADEKMIACVARFQPIKGQLKLAKAMNKLIREGYSITCLLIGGCIFGNKEDEEYYEKVKKYIFDNGLENRVIIMGERRDIPAILKEIDCLIIPSDNESFGMVAIEAMASKTPVLSTPNDGVSELLLFNPKYISKENSSESLTELMKQFFANLNDVDETLEFCEKRSRDFEISVIAERYMRVFGEKK